MTPIEVVKEYFPELSDYMAEDVLWSMTGWPAFWLCEDNCQKTQEIHLRDALQEIKDKVAQGVTILEQRREIERHIEDFAKEWRIGAELDWLLEVFDDYFHAGKFTDADNLLRMMQLGDFSTQLLVGALTATLGAKDKLQMRLPFYNRTKRLLELRGEDTKEILKGLE